jgi:hypothetical protein
LVGHIAHDIEIVKLDLRNHCGLAHGGPHPGCPSWRENAGVTADIASVAPIGKALSAATAAGGRALARVAPKLGRLGKAGDDAGVAAGAGDKVFVNARGEVTNG